MSNVYLITGASSDVGCALIRRLWQPGDVFIAQGAGDLGGLAELCKEHPGSIRTYDVDLTNEKALEAFIADVQASAEANPMGRNATPADVVPAMAFLLSDEAGFITGVTLPITGGSAL